MNTIGWDSPNSHAVLNESHCEARFHSSNDNTFMTVIACLGVCRVCIS